MFIQKQEMVNPIRLAEYTDLKYLPINTSLVTILGSSEFQT